MADHTPADRPPLWRVMHDAYLRSSLSGPVVRHGFTREILALRDWLVPEELDPPVPGPHEQCVGSRWAERQRLRAMLTAEADRAERGETADG